MFQDPFITIVFFSILSPMESLTSLLNAKKAYMHRKCQELVQDKQDNEYLEPIYLQYLSFLTQNVRFTIQALQQLQRYIQSPQEKRVIASQIAMLEDSLRIHLP